jgi:hypothetical protein
MTLGDRLVLRDGIANVRFTTKEYQENNGHPSSTPRTPSNLVKLLTCIGSREISRY